MEDFKVFSLDTIERAGFEFKISSNNYDGSVLIFAKNDFLSYASFRYFSSPKQGSEWIDKLVSTTKALYRQFLDG